MRILLVAGSYPPEPCGVGDYTEKLANTLSKIDGLQVGVLTALVPERRQSTSGRVDIMNLVRRWTLTELPKIVTYIRRWNPDIVHIQYPAQGFFNRRLPPFLPILIRALGFIVVETWHEPPPHTKRAMLYFLLPLVGATGIIYVRPGYLRFFSPQIQKLIKRLPNILIENAAAVPVSGLDAEEKRSLRDKYLGEFSRLLVFFGFVNRNKGLHSLIEIAESGIDRLVIAGKVGDEGYVKELIEFSRTKGVDNAVSFLGYLEPHHAADLLAVADAVVLPFVDGGGSWNTSIHSALNQGTFVLTTGFEGFGYDPERNIFVSHPRGMLEMRDAVRRYAGLKVRNPVRESGWQRIAGSHVDFYRQCLMGRMGGV